VRDVVGSYVAEHLAEPGGVLVVDETGFLKKQMTSTELLIPGYVAGTWNIDSVHSYVGFVIMHLMVSRVRGHFGTFSGQITTADNPLNSSVSVSIDANSIDTANQIGRLLRGREAPVHHIHLHGDPGRGRGLLHRW
jgi:polyisoprenoid-binding protein YceI